MKTAMYLSGGGARGAYQVGVLKALSEILSVKKLPADILSSLSVGSINAAFLGVYSDDFPHAVEELEKLWKNLKCDKVYKTSNLSLIKSVLRNVFGMILGLKLEGGGYLLDASPLKSLLEECIDFQKISQNIESGILDAFETSATCYEFAETSSFFTSASVHEGWTRERHVSYSTPITCDHILASSAIPLFFPAIKMDRLHFGDGAMRLTAPLRASIKLGAERIFVIGTRGKHHLAEKSAVTGAEGISFAKVLGAMMNALFLDNLERDVELILKINSIISMLSCEEGVNPDWKSVEVLTISPSIDLALPAEGRRVALPFLLRYLMRMLGSKKQSGDILSFLLFDSSYCEELISIGYKDAMAQREAIELFFQHSDV